ncbi:MAG: PrsW family glutamic-type intramembrane protease [Candidatus Parcubacteria bacterium]|nr:PrsW family glutamic-type intramembrane protease [Candidatus Parcubacteria bacterium]
MITTDPKVLGLAFLGGILPSLFWLWFWLKEENKKPEPKMILSMVFITGIFSVILVLPIQKFILAHIDSANGKLILWAATEEILKFLAVFVVIYKTKYDHKPIDWPIYLVTTALGFAALENTLFLIKPLATGENTLGFLTGELRFLGSTLLHAVTSGLLGLFIGFSLHKKLFSREFYFIVGLSLAIALHSIFNFFIIENSGSDFLKVFVSLWITAVVVMLFFEKVRRMN